MKTAIQIAQEANLKHIVEIAKSIGLSEDDIDQYGKYKAKVHLDVYKRMKDKPDGKLVVVTALTPTPAGEGKTTTAIGLTQALGQMGKKVIVTLREPSLGPVFGTKGGGAGGGYAQVQPMEDINLLFTGDMPAVSASHNVCAALMDNHLYRGNALGFKLGRIVWKRVIDQDERALRNIIVGLGSLGGVPRETGFDITSASEVTAILALATSLTDLKERLAKITLGYGNKFVPITAADIKAQGVMALLLKDAIMPNLVQTLENNPAFVHGGPFANIAHGCPSLIAIKTSLKLADYVVLEPGFGSDLGAEKFMDVTARIGGLTPDAGVVVATLKAIRYHGGVPLKEVGNPNLEATKKGLANLGAHIENVKQYGIPVVATLNFFPTDTDEEIEVVRKYCEEMNTPFAVSKVFLEGGSGGMDLAKKVLEGIEKQPSQYKPLYTLDIPYKERIDIIAKKVYGADGVVYSANANNKLRRVEKRGNMGLLIMMAKTQYSLSDDPKKLCRPKDFKITITDIREATGAGFLVALCGDIRTLPALPSNPAAEKMDIDEDGTIYGLF